MIFFLTGKMGMVGVFMASKMQRAFVEAEMKNGMTAEGAKAKFHENARKVLWFFIFVVKIVSTFKRMVRR